MKPSAIFTRCVGAVFLVGACLSAGLAVSVARHPDLVAYGLHATRPVVYLTAAGFVVGALVWLGLA
ncbi:MAG: hypothetical protein NT167_03540, partial [Verrucomicrobia bacterium]|nr:hypothetical protein [Verrucomicrobiota bacterium]